MNQGMSEDYHADLIYFNKREYKKLTEAQYSKEKYRLQVELLKLQEWVIAEKKRVAIVFEGRDAAGKGSTIQRFIEHLIPKAFRVVALGIPTPEESEHWFQRYERVLPREGEIVFFDRSWYNRALVEPTMGYCTMKQYKYFMNNVNQWENALIDSGMSIIKFYLSISRHAQLYRFRARQNSPLKYWKYSKNDQKAADQFERYTYFKEIMFEETSTKWAPWVVIDTNVKMIGRLNAIRYVLNHFDYGGKKVLKDQKWTKETVGFSLSIGDVKFENLSEEQYEVLLKLRQEWDG